MGWQALMDLTTHSLDDVQNGSTYGRVQLADLTNGRVDIDKVQEGTTNKFITATARAKLSGIEAGAEVNEVTGSNIIAKINASAEGIDIDDDVIPNLAASKITSGTFGVDRIPALPASKITSGAFDVARIPSLDASKITTGSFNTARIPSLDAGKITSGTFSTSRIPSLDASKITSGQFGVARLNIDGTLDIGQNTLQNLKLESGTTFPSTPVEGQLYRKDGVLYVYKAA